MTGQPVEVTNFPESSAKERVAFDLYKNLEGLLPTAQSLDQALRARLTLYSRCRHLVRTGEVKTDGIF